MKSQKPKSGSCSNMEARGSNCQRQSHITNKFQSQRPRSIDSLPHFLFLSLKDHESCEHMNSTSFSLKDIGGFGRHLMVLD